MHKRTTSHIHIAHTDPKRQRLHQFNDTDIADIAIAIMVGIFDLLPYTDTDDDIYNGIHPYINDVTRVLKYDDIPFDELTTYNFRQAAITITGQKCMNNGSDTFYLVAEQAIIIIQTGRDTVAQRNRYGSVDVPYTFPVNDSIIAVMNQFYDYN